MTRLNLCEMVKWQMDSEAENKIEAMLRVAEAMRDDLDRFVEHLKSRGVDVSVGHLGGLQHACDELCRLSGEFEELKARRIVLDLLVQYFEEGVSESR